MKLSFSNFLAAVSILVWATSWAATEKSATAFDSTPAAPAGYPSSAGLTCHAQADTGLACTGATHAEARSR